MLGFVYLFFALIALLGCLYHILYAHWDWLQTTTRDLVMDPQYYPDYLLIPSEFWGALLLGLCLALALEGYYKIRQDSADENF